MRLPREGREYITWATTGLPAGAAVQVRFLPDTTWYPTEPVTGGVRALVAGPAATGNPSGTIALTATGRHIPDLRVVDNPEVVIRAGGPVDVI